VTERQQEIIDTAVAIIADEGIQRLTTKELSRRIGISEPALYRHFESKLAILVAILDHFAGWSRTVLREIGESELSAPDQIRELFRRQTTRFMEAPAISGVIFAEEIFKDPPELMKSMMEIMGRTESHLREILVAGMQAGTIRRDVPLEHLALMTLGSLRLLVTRWRLAGYGFDLVAAGTELAESVVTFVGGQA
jgi:TetR/AcrR family transcriptional regulator, fatty acid metabolism regulator protein